LAADGWSGERRRGTCWWDEGRARAPKLEQRLSEPPGKGEEVGEGSWDADMWMGDASAVTGMPLAAECHSRVVPPASARALVQAGRLRGAGAETPRLSPTPFPSS